MKKMIIGLALLTSLPSFSVASRGAIKVMDGALALCESARDIMPHRNAMGAYRGQVESLEILNNDILRFKVSLDFLKCKKVGTTFDFANVPTYSSGEYNFRDENDIVKHVKFTPSEIRFQGYRDGAYVKFFDIIVPKSNNGKYSSSVHLNVSDVLSAKQIKLLENGQKVVGSYDFWITKKVEWKIDNKKTNDLDNMVNFGNFRALFKLYLNNGVLVAELL